MHVVVMKVPITSCTPRRCGLLNHPTVSAEECSSLTQNLMQIHCSTHSVSHFECDGHTVHMLTQRCLPPPLTSTVKSPLLTHVHSSPLSLPTRLHHCCTNYSWLDFFQTDLNISTLTVVCHVLYKHINISHILTYL